MIGLKVPNTEIYSWDRSPHESVLHDPYTLEREVSIQANHQCAELPEHRIIADVVMQNVDGTL